MKIFLHWSIILTYSSSSKIGIILIVQNNVMVERTTCNQINPQALLNLVGRK